MGAEAISRNCCCSIWCWSCQGYCCWCCCRRRHWWSCPSWCYWLWPWKESGSWGQEAGADQDRLGAEEEGTVWQVCRTEWQEECHVKEDAKPKFTKWKRHAVDEMETACTT